MKRKNIWHIGLLLVGILTLGACGGPGTGPGGVLGTGTFIKTADNGAGFYWPDLLGDTAASRYMMLYLAGEVNGSGNINAIKFKYAMAEPSAITCPDVTIKMGHTSVSTLGTTFASNVEEGRGSFATVLSNASVSIPAGSAGDILTINLDTPFSYNGVDNLVVEVTRADACTSDFSVATDAVAYNGNVKDDTSDVIATGIAYLYSNYAEFVFAGGDNAQVFGGASSNTWPFSASLTRVQMLYLASEVDGSGPITGIGFQVNATTAMETYTYKVTLGHTTLSALTSIFGDNYDAGAPTVVANSLQFTIPAGVPNGTFVWVPLTGSFNYNGTDNLIVDIEVPAATGDTALRTTNTSAGRRVSDLLAGGSLAVDAVTYHAKFRFNGGTMDVLTPDGMTGGWGDAFPFATADGRRQWLYRAAELGTKGTINKIACRAWSAGGAADTGFNYTVVMSHTSATTLGTNFAANLSSPVTVFSGTIDLPTVSGGDWYEIPLSTSFNYNGTDNLVVEIGGTGGTGVTGACILDNVNTTLYTSRRLWAGASTDLTGSVNDWLIDMRFTLQ